ncbi:MAG: hypothetical protein ACE5EQ_11515, partial [Phycisphaerae bacterium]
VDETMTHGPRLARRFCMGALVLTGALSPVVRADPPHGRDQAIADFFGSVRTAGGGYFQVVGSRPDQIRDRFSLEGKPAAMSWRVDVSSDSPNQGLAIVVPPFSGGDVASKELGETERFVPRFLDIELIGELRERKIGIHVTHTAGDHGRPTHKTLATLVRDQLDSSRWQILRVPIPAGLRGLHRGPVRLTFEGRGAAWVAIQRMRWRATDGPQEWKPSRPSPEPRRQVMWVWNTDRILIDVSKRESLLEFCRARSITDLFFEFPYDYEDETIQPRHVAEQRALNKAAHRAGILMHALDGAVEYVLPRNHERMFRLVDALERFNRTASPEEQYPALHLDNEPYQLPEWADVRTRQKVIDDYLRLNRELRRRTQAAGLEFGLDIPFWWDLRKGDGSPEFPSKVDGRTVSLAEAIFQCAQNVGVMSYRERVIGPDGVVALCHDEFRLGQRYGVDVFAAVELGTQPEVEDGTTFGVFPRQYVQDQLTTLRHALGFEPGCSGLAIHYYDAYSRLPA